MTEKKPRDIEDIKTELLDAMSNPPTELEKAFYRKALVALGQHGSFERLHIGKIDLVLDILDQMDLVRDADVARERSAKRGAF